MLPRALGLTLALICLLAGVAHAQDGVVVIKAKTVITVSGQEFTPGMIVIKDGKIEAVGNKIELPPRARVIDAPDDVVMPGLVNPRTRYGLANYRRAGNNADLHVAPELFPREDTYQAPLEAGFVVLGLIPNGSGIAGHSVAIRPVPGDRDAIVMPGTGYLRVTHARMPGDKRNLVGAFKAADAAIAREAKAKKAFEAKAKKAAAAAAAKAKAEAAKKAAEAKKAPPKKAPPPKTPGKKAPAKKAPPKPPAFKPPPIPPKIKPFVDYIRDPKAAPRLVVELLKASDLVHFDDAVSKRKLEPVFLIANGQTSDLFRAVEGLSEKGATVVLYPQLSFEPYTKTRRNIPAELAKAGVSVAFVPMTDDAKGHATLLGAVGSLVREGLPREVALRAVTEIPARVLGLAGELGTVQKGRRADLTFLDADPFEADVRVTRVLIGGQTVWSEEERP